METENKYKSILMNPEIKLDYIYERLLDFDSIKDNPILKPISEINKSYCDRHIVITKGVLEFEEEYKRLQEMESINPRYTNTVLMALIKNMINIIKTIIYNQDLCDSSMKSAINEMIDISESKFKLIDNEKERMEKLRVQVRKEVEDEYKNQSLQETKLESSPNKIVSDSRPGEVYNQSNQIPTPVPVQNETEEDIIITDLKKIAGEGEPEKKEVIQNKPKKVYSSLLEREI